jgi:hypothetical protein
MVSAFQHFTIISYLLNRKSVSFAKLTRLLTAQPKDKSTNLRPIGPQSSNDTVTDM